MAKVEELQAKVFDSKEKAEQYSEVQNKKEVNIGGIDRSIEEWDIE